MLPRLILCYYPDLSQFQLHIESEYPEGSLKTINRVLSLLPTFRIQIIQAILLKSTQYPTGPGTLNSFSTKTRTAIRRRRPTPIQPKNVTISANIAVYGFFFRLKEFIIPGFHNLLGNRQAKVHTLQGMRFSTCVPFGASVKTFVRYSKGTSPFSLAETMRL